MNILIILLNLLALIVSGFALGESAERKDVIVCCHDVMVGRLRGVGCFIALLSFVHRLNLRLKFFCLILVYLRLLN